jgi:flavin reductase (DIM6/NTAB) family NADH-FMN oxidoreductase RutF
MPRPSAFFNVFSEHAALSVLGLQHNPDGSAKDTTHNMHASGEFVVYLVDEGIAEAINVTATDFPPGQGEPLAWAFRRSLQPPTSCRGARCPRMSPHGEPRLRPAA